MKLVTFFLFLNYLSFSQNQFDSGAHPLGGDDNVQLIFQSQLVYPENLLKKNINEDVIIYFNVLKDGSVINYDFKENYHSEFKEEAIRILKYILFEPASISNIKVDSKTSILLKFNTTTYKKYCKIRGFTTHKQFNLFDTSYVIYERADISAQYYKGDEALNDFILSNLEYPDLAIRQNIHGTVILSFIVEPNGCISNFKVEKEFNHLCTNEAIKVLRNTKWEAGKKDGKLIRYKIKYPITFSLNNINKDNATSEQR